MPPSAGLADQDATDQFRAYLVKPAAEIGRCPAPGAGLPGYYDHAVHVSGERNDFGGNRSGRGIEQHELIGLPLAFH
jgi:hypothetical protein